MNAKRLPTILEVCAAEHWPNPVSHADIVSFVQRCEARGIITNCSGLNWWREYTVEGIAR